MIQIYDYRIDKNILTIAFKVKNCIIYSDIVYDKASTKEELLQTAYEKIYTNIEYEKGLEIPSILYIPEVPEKTFEEFIPAQPKAKRIECDFNILDGKVLDQYGNDLNIKPIFSIEGTCAEILNGKVVEKEVNEVSEYFIIAKHNMLVEKQKRYVYPNVPNPSATSEIDKMQEHILDLEFRVSKQELGI